MRHQIPTGELGPLGPAMAEAVTACVHCGFCLPACPTYRLLGQEMDSPRGRIVLMKEALEGTISLDDARPHVDRCLGCMSCVSACPSGVAYGDLLSPFRDHLRRAGSGAGAGRHARLRRRLLLATLTRPGRLRPLVALARLIAPLGRRLPGRLGALFALLPERSPRAGAARATRGGLYPARGERRARVALLEGCAQRVLAPEIHRATVAVLRHNGVEVLVPPAQGCCGALAWHAGDLELARRQARRNLAAFPGDVDAVVTDAAGCGSGMHEYGLLLAGEAEEAAGRRFAAKVEDVASFLARLGWRTPPALAEPLRLAYHDACHLQHAQGEREAPRRLLRSIPGLELLEVPRREVCCGSAGTYNLEQPAIAAELGSAKAEDVLATGAELVATGNVGCLVQLRAHLARRPGAPRVRHTLEVLAEAYGI